MSVYVGNLSYDATDEDLKDAFAEYGNVKRVQVPNDRETGRSRGFGFVELTDDAAAREAISKMDGTDLGGRQIKVNEAKPRR